MYKKILNSVLIGAIVTVLIILIVFLLTTIVSVNNKKEYTHVMGKVVAKADFKPDFSNTDANNDRLSIVFKVPGDEYVRLDCSFSRFQSTKIGDKVKLKKIEHFNTFGESEVFYDYTD